MMSITDPNMKNSFISSMEEIQNKNLKTFAELLDTTTELSQSHMQFVKSALDTCVKKSKDDEKLFETIQEYKQDLGEKSVALKEKQRAISEITSEVQKKELQKEEFIQKIEKLNEDQAKRREVIISQHKANKDRLRKLQKARVVFQENLGVEIRTIIDKTQVVKGEKLQFVFRNVNPVDQDSAYIITMGIKENGSYQVVSSDPKLECLPVLESRLQETNNLPAFLANVRKEFLCKARS